MDLFGENIAFSRKAVSQTGWFVLYYSWHEPPLDVFVAYLNYTKWMLLMLFYCLERLIFQGLQRIIYLRSLSLEYILSRKICFYMRADLFNLHILQLRCRRKPKPLA